MGCGLACGSWSKVKKGAFKGSSTEGPEYETIGLSGSNCGISNIEAIVKFSEECDKLGLDTMSAGSVTAFAMDLYERKILTKKDTGGLDLKFGNEDAFVKMPAIIAKRENIGDALADGSKRAAKKIGKGAEKLVIESKGSEYPAYDPRGSIGMALAYATSDRGADHNRAWPVAQDAYGSGDPWNTEGNFKNMARYYTEVTGVPSDEDYLRSIGKRVWNLTRAFNAREGFTKKDDNMPERMEKEPLPSGKTKGKAVPRADFEKMLAEYYKLWSWDEQGRPTKKTLDEVGLSDIAKKLPYLK